MSRTFAVVVALSGSFASEVNLHEVYMVSSMLLAVIACLLHVQSRAESYVTDSPREKPTPKRISYSKGFFRNWLEILLPGTIRAAGSAATHSVPESSTKGNNARKYGTRKKKKQ